MEDSTDLCYFIHRLWCQDDYTVVKLAHVMVKLLIPTWSTLGKYWMRKPRRIPATIPPATSRTPLRRLYQVEPGRISRENLQVIQFTALIVEKMCDSSRVKVKSALFMVSHVV